MLEQRSLGGGRTEYSGGSKHSGTPTKSGGTERPLHPRSTGIAGYLTICGMAFHNYNHGQRVLRCASGEGDGGARQLEQWFLASAFMANADLDTPPKFPQPDGHHTPILSRRTSCDQVDTGGLLSKKTVSNGCPAIIQVQPGQPHGHVISVI